MQRTPGMQRSVQHTPVMRATCNTYTSHAALWQDSPQRAATAAQVPLPLACDFSISSSNFHACQRLPFHPRIALSACCTLSAAHCPLHIVRCTLSVCELHQRCGAARVRVLLRAASARRHGPVAARRGGHARKWLAFITIFVFRRLRTAFPDSAEIGKQGHPEPLPRADSAGPETGIGVPWARDFGLARGPPSFRIWPRPEGPRDRSPAWFFLPLEGGQSHFSAAGDTKNGQKWLKFKNA